MNSLRRMLAEVPQLEAKLGIWVGGNVPKTVTAVQMDASTKPQPPSSPGHGEYRSA